LRGKWRVLKSLAPHSVAPAAGEVVSFLDIVVVFTVIQDWHEATKVIDFDCSDTKAIHIG
jgi:hypothetical protein